MVSPRNLLFWDWVSNFSHESLMMEVEGLYRGPASLISLETWVGVKECVFEMSSGENSTTTLLDAGCDSPR